MIIFTQIHDNWAVRKQQDNWEERQPSQASPPLGQQGPQATEMPTFCFSPRTKIPACVQSIKMRSFRVKCTSCFSYNYYLESKIGSLTGDASVLSGFETDCHKTSNVVQAGFKLMEILLHLPSNCWDNRDELLAFSLKSSILILRWPEAGG